MDKVYMNMQEYLGAKVTHLRFVELGVVVNCQAKSLYMREYRWRSPVNTEKQWDAYANDRGQDLVLNIFNCLT